VNNTEFAKGMALGMAAGAAVGMIAAPKRKKSKPAQKVLRAAGAAADSLANMVK